MFDSHVHFDLAPDCRAPGRALAAGVRGAFNPAVDLTSSRRALDLHGQHPWILPGFGIHPQFLANLDCPPTAELEALGARAEYVAIGEVGLDFWGGRGDEARQRAFLDTQARLAAALGLPLVLHLRKAFYDGFAVLKEAGFHGPAVCHNFSGSREMARLALDRGAFLGAGRTLLGTAGDRLREVYRWAPRDRVLVETDSPPPAGRLAAGCQPWELGEVVEALARVWDSAPEEVAERTWDNAVRVFGEPIRDSASASPP